MTIVTMHLFDENHLADVIEIARQVGKVEINAYSDGELVYALEGVHRTEAAKRLGLPIMFTLKSFDDLISTDLQDVEVDENGCATVESIFEYAYSTGVEGSIYSENDFGEVTYA